MADITTENIKKLREVTGAGIMDCKKALSKAEGNFEKAQEILRQKGAEKAEKKKDRATNSGIVKTFVKGNSGVIIELNCETDFVAKNESFQGLADAIARMLMDVEENSVSADALPESVKAKLQESLSEAIGKIGENMSLRRCQKLSFAGNGKITDYVHMGGKIGVLVELTASSKEAADSPVVAELAKNLAMQIAAQAPRLVSRDCFTEEELNKQKALINELAAEENPNKPANIVERIANGKLEKYFQSACLVDQIYIKDSSLNIAQLLQKVSKEAGGDIKVKRFVRFSLGE